MGFRVSYFWQQANKKSFGWTENYWNSTSNLSACITQANNLATKLRTAKGDQTLMAKIRISTVGLARAVTPLEGTPARGGTSFPSDYPTTKLQLQLTDGTRKTSQWFGGVIDDVVKSGGFYLPTSARRRELDNLIAELAAGGNSWSLYGLVGAPTYPRVPISGFDPATGVVTTAVAHGLVNGNKVRVSRARGNTVLNGIWYITLITTTTFSLNLWQPSQVALTKSNAYVQRQEYAFTKISGGAVLAATKHNVGKPSDLASGKAKKKKS